MWYKWLTIPAAIAALIVLFSGPEKTTTMTDQAPVLRRASNVVLFEHADDGSRSISITAREVMEKSDQTAYLADFDISSATGLRIRGTHARYNFERSLLEVEGLVSIETTDGVEGTLNGLSWDREANIASTDNPLRLTGPQGTIQANRATFQDDFTLIQFSGGVHAKISPDMLRS